MTERQEDDFASLFEASTKAKPVSRGQTIDGTIVAIGKEVAFVSVGGKGEATIDLAEVKDEDGKIEVAVGERIQAVVVSTDGGIVLSRRLARGAANARQLEEAFHSRLAVEGKVVGPIKGGYEIRIGHARAFCPLSQIDVRRDTPAEQHTGRVYAFRITEFRDGGRSVVVSRRALQEEEQRAQQAEVRATLVPGAVVNGHVASVREFGAFVELGAGIQGLLHVSEMGWSRVNDPAAFVKPGDAITVKVLRVDEDGQKIALGLKQLGTDPWSIVESTYPAGAIVAGRVTRISEFGAFIELAPGIEALAHVSTFPPTGRGQDWRQLVTPGATARVEILTVDATRRRIGVSLVGEPSTESSEAESENVAPESANEPRFSGSLADKLRGALERK